MTVQTQTSARKASVALLAILGLVLATFVAAAPVLAEHTGPLVDPDTETYDFPGDNPDCDDLVADEFISGYDEEDTSDPGGDTFAFTAPDGWLVVAAIIKGGNEGAAVYVYEGGVDHDNGLMTPTGQDISHVTLCLIEEEEESQPESVPESEPEGSELGETGDPSVPDTATSLPGFGGPLATLVFGAILVASLGALAYANVAAARRRG